MLRFLSPLKLEPQAGGNPPIVTRSVTSTDLTGLSVADLVDLHNWLAGRPTQSGIVFRSRVSSSKGKQPASSLCEFG
jgi:hypothetical protein